MNGLDEKTSLTTFCTSCLDSVDMTILISPLMYVPRATQLARRLPLAVMN